MRPFSRKLGFRLARSLGSNIIYQGKRYHSPCGPKDLLCDPSERVALAIVRLLQGIIQLQTMDVHRRKDRLRLITKINFHEPQNVITNPVHIIIIRSFTFQSHAELNFLCLYLNELKLLCIIDYT